MSALTASSTVLTRYRPKPKVRKEHNLLTSKEEVQAQEKEEEEVMLVVPPF